MMSSQFNLGPTSKTLNLFFLQFIERSGFQNLSFFLNCLNGIWRIWFNNNPKKLKLLSQKHILL